MQLDFGRIFNVSVKAGAPLTRQGFGTIAVFDASFPSSWPTPYYIPSVQSEADYITAGGHQYDATWKLLKDIFAQDDHPASVIVAKWDKTGNETLAHAMQSLDAVFADWYIALVAPASLTQTAILSGAGYIESRGDPANTGSPGLFLPEIYDTASKTIGGGEAHAINATVPGPYNNTKTYWHSPPQQVSTLTFSAALVVNNSFAMKVNGATIGPTVFAVDSDTTMAAIAATLAALNTIIASAVVTSGGPAADDNRVIVITALEQVWIEIENPVVTLGASQAAVVFDHVSGGPESLAAAMASSRANSQPGSETWKQFGDLKGITPDQLGNSDRAALDAANTDHVDPYSTTMVVAESKVSSGEWLDVIRFIAWLTVNLKDDFADFFVSLSPKKVPYTDRGIAALENIVRARLDKGVAAGGISPDVAYQVTFPLAKDVDAGTKATRKLTGFFDATLAGAIHFVTVKGTVHL